MLWRRRFLHNQLADIRKRAGEPLPNGARRLEISRWPRARDLAVVLAILILLSLIPRSCEVNRKPAARIAQAEQQIREHAELESWPVDKTRRVIARLHRRYMPGEES